MVSYTVGRSIRDRPSQVGLLLLCSWFPLAFYITLCVFYIIWKHRSQYYELVYWGFDNLNKFTHNYCVVKLGIVLHLYQPYAQIESVFKRVTAECYIPLINYIKSTKTKLTLNIPLSTLEQFEKYGYTEVLKDLKNLYDGEIIELTGTGAYHPLLTRIPLDYAENQILLQEYGLGYFFGSHGAQDEAKQTQLKDINGFFPPELAFNPALTPVLDAMGYQWVLVEDIAVENNLNRPNTFFKLKDFNITFVCRNSFLSNLLSFKRDTDGNSISNHVINTLNSAVSQTLVIAFDAECLGHQEDRNAASMHALHQLLIGVHVPGVDTRSCDEDHLATGWWCGGTCF